MKLGILSIVIMALSTGSIHSVRADEMITVPFGNQLVDVPASSVEPYLQMHLEGGTFSKCDPAEMILKGGAAAACGYGYLQCVSASSGCTLGAPVCIAACTVLFYACLKAIGIIC